MKIKQIFILIWKEFIYGGHLQCLGTVSIVLVSSILLNIKITWDILFISYLLFYPIYLYNRWKELSIDYLTNPQRTEYLRTYIKKAPIILTFVISVLLASLIYFANLRFIIFALLLLLFGLLYSISFKKLTKKIPLFKNFYVAIFFSLVAVFPIIYYSYALNLNSIFIISVILFMIFVFLKAFMMQILLDLKDVESDKKEELKTFSVMFGEGKTFTFLKIFSVLATLPIIVIFSLYFRIFPKSILILLLTVPFDFYCFKLAKEQKYSGYLLMSGLFLFWLVLILIGNFILL